MQSKQTGPPPLHRVWWVQEGPSPYSGDRKARPPAPQPGKMLRQALLVGALAFLICRVDANTKVTDAQEGATDYFGKCKNQFTDCSCPKGFAFVVDVPEGPDSGSMSPVGRCVQTCFVNNSLCSTSDDPRQVVLKNAASSTQTLAALTIQQCDLGVSLDRFSCSIAPLLATQACVDNGTSCGDFMLINNVGICVKSDSTPGTSTCPSGLFSKGCVSVLGLQCRDLVQSEIDAITSSPCPKPIDDPCPDNAPTCFNKYPGGETCKEAQWLFPKDDSSSCSPSKDSSSSCSGDSPALSGQDSGSGSTQSQAEGAPTADTEEIERQVRANWSETHIHLQTRRHHRRRRGSPRAPRAWTSPRTRTAATLRAATPRLPPPTTTGTMSWTPAGRAQPANGATIRADRKGRDQRSWQRT